MNNADAPGTLRSMSELRDYSADEKLFDGSSIQICAIRSDDKSGFAITGST